MCTKRKGPTLADIQIFQTDQGRFSLNVRDWSEILEIGITVKT